MQEIDWDIQQITDYLKQNKDAHLICFGAGMVAQHVKYLFEELGLWDRVRFFIDNDTEKQKQFFKVGSREIAISGVETLYNGRLQKDIIIILCEWYQDVEKQLQEDMKIVPQVYCKYVNLNKRIIKNGYEQEKQNAVNIFKMDTQNHIPPIIHYCWFGEKTIPEEQKKYINNWQKICPQYEIILWNEDNYDISKCRYVYEAFKTQNYAFVSDYVRMDVVYEYGGIYLDTDVELIKNMDCLRKYDAFFSYGKWPAIASGCGFGAKPHLELIREIRDNPRANMGFIDSRGRENKTTNSIYETQIMEKEGFKMNFATQIMKNVIVCSPYFFPSKEHMDIADEDLAIAYHHDAGSWRK